MAAVAPQMYSPIAVASNSRFWKEAYALGPTSSAAWYPVGNTCKAVADIDDTRPSSKPAVLDTRDGGLSKGYEQIAAVVHETYNSLTMPYTAPKEPSQHCVQLRVPASK